MLVYDIRGGKTKSKTGFAGAGERKGVLLEWGTRERERD